MAAMAAFKGPVGDDERAEVLKSFEDEAKRLKRRITARKMYGEQAAAKKAKVMPQPRQPLAPLPQHHNQQQPQQQQPKQQARPSLMPPQLQEPHVGHDHHEHRAGTSRLASCPTHIGNPPPPAAPRAYETHRQQQQQEEEEEEEKGIAKEASTGFRAPLLQRTKALSGQGPHQQARALAAQYLEVRETADEHITFFETAEAAVSAAADAAGGAAAAAAGGGAVDSAGSNGDDDNESEDAGADDRRHCAAVLDAAAAPVVVGSPAAQLRRQAALLREIKYTWCYLQGRLEEGEMLAEAHAKVTEVAGAQAVLLDAVRHESLALKPGLWLYVLERVRDGGHAPRMFAVPVPTTAMAAAAAEPAAESAESADQEAGAMEAVTSAVCEGIAKESSTGFRATLLRRTKALGGRPHQQALAMAAQSTALRAKAGRQLAFFSRAEAEVSAAAAAGGAVGSASSGGGDDDGADGRRHCAALLDAAAVPVVVGSPAAQLRRQAVLLRELKELWRYLQGRLGEGGVLAEAHAKVTEVAGAQAVLLDAVRHAALAVVPDLWLRVLERVRATGEAPRMFAAA